MARRRDYCSDKVGLAGLVTCRPDALALGSGSGRGRRLGTLAAQHPRGLTSNRHAGRPDRWSIRAFAFPQLCTHSRAVAFRDDQPAKRVIETPGRHPLTYLIIAIVAALAVWVIWQPSIDSPKSAPATIARSTETSPEVVSEQRSDDRNASPARGDLRTLFSADDYPADAVRNEEQRTVQAELSVDPQGRVSACRIIRSSGHTTLDQATCQILQRWATFRPARDAHGTPVPDRVTTPPVVWRLEG